MKYLRNNKYNAFIIAYDHNLKEAIQLFRSKDKNMHNQIL